MRLKYGGIMTTERPLPLKTIGVLGSLSNQTYEYYRLINNAVNERLGGWDIAETVIQGVNYGNFEHFSRNQMWDEAGDYLSAKAQAAERAGAELLICASHTMHRVAERITESIRIPFIHVVDPTAEAITAAGFKKVALLGTKPVMAADYLHARYRERYGIEIIVPNDPEQRRIDQLMFDELNRQLFNKETKKLFIDVCASLYQRGAQGVIFSFTEISQLLAPDDMPGFPIFDTTALHVEAAVKIALG